MGHSYEPGPGEYLVHFCELREGSRTASASAATAGMSAEQKVAAILEDGVFKAHSQFLGGVPAVSFSECGPGSEHLEWVLKQGLAEPWGILIKRDWVARYGGGPALSVTSTTRAYLEILRRLEVEKSGSATFADKILGFAVRFDEGQTSRSDWLRHREWRLPALDGEHLIPGTFLDLTILTGVENWAPNGVRPSDRKGNTFRQLLYLNGEFREN